MNTYKNRVILTVISSLFLAFVYSLAWQGASAIDVRAADTTSEPGSIEISIIEDKISADIKGAPVKAVLDKLQEEYGLSYKVDGNVSNRAVFVKFEGMPLEEGIRRILSPLSCMMVYGENERIKKLFVIDVLLGESVALGPGTSLEGSPYTELSPGAQPSPEGPPSDEPPPQGPPSEPPPQGPPTEPPAQGPPTEPPAQGPPTEPPPQDPPDEPSPQSSPHGAISGPLPETAPGVKRLPEFVPGLNPFPGSNTYGN
jgi:hypothetical protein